MGGSFQVETMVDKKVSIIILSYNDKELIKQCLASLRKWIKDGERAELIVVDNASTDGSVEYLRGLNDVVLIESKENLGFTGGNNLGISYALDHGADYIMLLNNDVVVKDAFWRPLVKFLEENNKIGVVGPKIYLSLIHI